MTLILKSIEKEEADCRARCEGMKVGDWILHCHHEVLLERLTEPVENRINYILRSKTDNVALRLRLMTPPILDAEVLADAELNKARAEWDKADAELNKADAEWRKADAEWNKARAELYKVDAEWRKARAEWRKARAEWNKVDAEWRKADAELNKARAEWNKARAELNKVDAEWRKADAELNKAYLSHYARLYPNSPWNGETIFAGEFAL